MAYNYSALDEPFDLASTAEPWVVVAHDDDHVVGERISALTPDGVVKRLDSARMTDTAGLFREFAEKLELPPHFGHNWYALVDCLDDLHSAGHGRLPVAVVVEDADQVVNEEFFPLFVAILCEAAERANLSLDADDLPRDRPPFPLHFVFLVKDAGIGQVAAQLHKRGDMVIRESDGRLLVGSRR